MKRLLLILVVLFFSSIPLLSFAEEEVDHTVSGTLTLATDYVFRGISQTNENPSVQGSFDYGHACGVYAGVWASNIDFADSIEIDWYVGFTNAIGELTYDLTAFFYSYPGADDNAAEMDYWEFHVGLFYEIKMPLAPTIGVAYDYSPDFFGEDDTAHHYSSSLDLTLPYDFGLGATVGYQDVTGDKTSPGGFDYAWWKISLSKELEGFELDLSYWDTNEEEILGENIASERIVFSITRSM